MSDTDPRDNMFTLYPYHNVVIRSAEGSTVRDTEGNEYLDLASGQLSANLGHSHPRLTEAARDQAARVVNLGNRFFAEATLEACAEIASVTQEGLDKVVLCSTGSEANELAVRMARAATGKLELVAVRNGYYGATHQMMSMSEYVGFIKGIGAASPGVHRLPCPDCPRCEFGLEPDTCEAACADRGAHHLEQDSTGSIAAVIVEPVLGSGGVIVPPAAWHQKVKALCEKTGALLIADEAQTGLGRTGRMMGMEHFGVVPDILVLSKGLGAGFPVAAVVTTAEIEEKCVAAPLANMSSHSFDPFGSAVAAEVVRVIKEEALVQRAERMGAYLHGKLEELAAAHPKIISSEVRGLGLMKGVDVISADTGQRDPMLSLALEAECLLRGVVVGYSALSGVLRILPPLVITEQEVDRAVAILGEAAGHIEEKGVDMQRYLPTHQGSFKLAFSFISKLQGA